jgi:hypothetical protein
VKNAGIFAGFQRDKLLWVICVLPTVVLLGGCGSGEKGAVSEIPEPQAAESSLERVSADVIEVSPPLFDPKDRTTWDTCWIGGKKLGYVKTVVSHENRKAKEIVKIDSLTRLTIQRDQQQTEMSIQVTTHQDTDGRLLDFQSQVVAGSLPSTTEGRVENDKLVIDLLTTGRKKTTSIPWSENYLGPFAVEQSLLGNPMKPGERRSIKMLVPIVNQIATTNLIARDYEPVELRSGIYRLLRIDTETVLPNSPPMTGNIWTDREGDTLKTFNHAMHQEIFRCTEAEALDRTELGRLDLINDMKIPVDRPLQAGEMDRQIQFRIKLTGGDPVAMLVESDSQAVRSLGSDTAEVTVYALRPGDKSGNENAPADQPGLDDIQPNSMIQSKDESVLAMAGEAVGELKDPWQIAVALEKYVKEHITEKDFTTGFATAAEVAKSRQGDCTEHAVLLAALARARDIPARVAMGLVYLPRDQAFFYHMWTEVYIDNRWIPLDATIGKGGTGADRLKLAHSNLKGASAYSSFLPVAQVMGRMKIEVLDDQDEQEKGVK